MQSPLTPEQQQQQRETMRSNLAFQLMGATLTVIGLTFTITQPLFQRIDNLNLAVARIEEGNRSTTGNLTAFERRLTRIETDLYTLQTKSDANTTSRLQGR